MPLAELRVAQWGEQAAIHHVPSGKTHFINRPSFVLLQTVLQEKKTTEAAADQLAALMGVAATPDYRQQVAELMERLDALGLIIRVTPARQSTW